MLNPRTPDGSETPGTLLINQEIGLDSVKSVSEQLTVIAWSVSVDAGASTATSKRGIIS